MEARERETLMYTKQKREFLLAGAPFDADSIFFDTNTIVDSDADLPQGLAQLDYQYATSYPLRP